MPNYLSQFLNLAFRIVAMGARFLLVLVLGKYFGASDLGVFGMLNTSIIIAYMIIGYDFYSYATREILKVPQHEQSNILFNQGIFYLLGYVVLLPFILYVIFNFDFLDEAFLLPFVILLFNEHIGQEFFRLFTTLQQPLTANFIFFVRSGSWVIVYLGLLFFNLLPESVSPLENLLWAWTAGAVLSNLIAVYIIYKFLPKGKLTLSFTWIKSGIRVSGWFFASTIAYKLIEFSNRYIIDYYHNKAAVGYYTFFNQIANLINVIVFTLVIMHLYPQLVTTAQKHEWEDFESRYSSFFRKIFKWTLVSSLVVGVAIFPVLIFLEKDDFFEHLPTFYWLLLSNILLNLSFAPHYALYAVQEDKKLFYSTVVGAILNLFLNFLLIPTYGVLGAAIGVTLSYLFVFMMKNSAKKRVFKFKYESQY